jgi:hypothetical protein
VPGEQQANTGIAFEMVRLAAAKIGIEHQPFFIIMLEQHDALVRLAVFINRGNNHGRGVSELSLAGLFQPALKKRQRFSGKILAAKTAFGVFTAQVRNLLQFVVI